MDTYSRLVLTVIALCLVAVLLGQLGLLPALGSAAAPAVSAGPRVAAESEDGKPRFTLTPVRVQQAFFLIRQDQITGQTWKVKFPVTLAGWDPILEADEAKALRDQRQAERAAKKAAEADDR